MAQDGTGCILLLIYHPLDCKVAPLAGLSRHPAGTRAGYLPLALCLLFALVQTQRLHALRPLVCTQDVPFPHIEVLYCELTKKSPRIQFRRACADSPRSPKRLSASAA